MTDLQRAILMTYKYRHDYLLETEGFTDEVEQLGDRIAWYCVLNNISDEEYNAL